MMREVVCACVWGMRLVRLKSLVDHVALIHLHIVFEIILPNVNDHFRLLTVQ
jgi:hypothetical protein